MIDFLTAFKAQIPFIGVQYDDPVNVLAVLKALTGLSPQVLPKVALASVGPAYVWYTDNMDMVTTENYKKLVTNHGVCVVINPDKVSPLVFDVGVLPTPESFYTDYLQDFVNEKTMPALVSVLRGLSVKASQEMVRLTMVRTGEITPKEVRKSRQLVSGGHQGLSPLETDYDFYEWPKELKEWLDLNEKYFLDPSTPTQLVPRGIILAGPAGTGKSMAAKVLARHWDVPLFRLDIAASLNKYIGTSEGRIAQSLTLIEQSAPCVWLLDESEKLFNQGADEGTGTIPRVLSQMLWWLQNHKARVLTIMTTNKLENLPPELYRSERLDRVITLETLKLSAAKEFAVKVYETVLQEPLPKARKKKLEDLMDDKDKCRWTPADVRVLVYEQIKINKWLG